MKLAAAIKYSRGARDSDPPEIKERSGEFEYVTLILFRGGGHLSEYDLPTETMPFGASRQNGMAARS
jgi:hypothetical protein